MIFPFHTIKKPRHFLVLHGFTTPHSYSFVVFLQASPKNAGTSRSSPTNSTTSPRRKRLPTGRGCFVKCHLEVSIAMGVPPNGWFLLGKIPLKWMIWGTPVPGTPHIALTCQPNHVKAAAIMSIVLARGEISWGHCATAARQPT